MTPAHLTVPHSAAARVATLWRKAADAFLDWQARRATRDMLRALDTRTLRDIGIDRNEVESVIHDMSRDRRRRYDADWRGMSR
jgi:uncharacterized protein YjiS (DUF1127 family)